MPALCPHNTRTIRCDRYFAIDYNGLQVWKIAKCEKFSYLAILGSSKPYCGTVRSSDSRMVRPPYAPELLPIIGKRSTLRDK